MGYYISKLISFGYSPHDAYQTYYSFLKEFSLNDLIIFINSLEEDAKNVGRV